MSFRRLVVASAIGFFLATAGVWSLASPPRQGFAPDPPVHVANKQWVFELAYEKGAGKIERARSVTVKKPIGTPRVMGRFALELWVGRELLDRVRFDVPLLGDDEGERDPKRRRKRPKFSRVTTKLKAQMADHPRATVLAFVDRATGESEKYFWPPDENGTLKRFSAKAALGGDAPVDAGADSAPSTIPDAGGDGDAAGEGDAGVDGSASKSPSGGERPEPK